MKTYWTFVDKKTGALSEEGPIELIYIFTSRSKAQAEKRYLCDPSAVRIQKIEIRMVPLYSEEEPGDHTREVEEALVRLQRDPVYEFEQSDYRRRLVAAINLLPDNQRRVIELQLQDIPIESNDPDEITMVKILGCVEKTVRNRRDRGYAALRDLLSPKGEAND